MGPMVKQKTSVSRLRPPARRKLNGPRIKLEFTVAINPPRVIGGERGKVAKIVNGTRRWFARARAFTRADCTPSHIVLVLIYAAHRAFLLPRYRDLSAANYTFRRRPPRPAQTKAPRS